MDTGLLHDATSKAHDGYKIALVTDTLTHAGECFNQVLDILDDRDVSKVSRTNGRQAIDFPSGGRISFISLRQSNRSKTFDRAYVPARISDDVLQDLVPCLATSSDGAIVGYF